MTRELRSQTRNPALVAAYLDILESYASGATPKTEFQRAMFGALAKSDPDRTISARQLGNFDRAPARLKAPVFGRRKRGQFAGLDDDRLQQIFRAADPGLAYFDDVGDPIIPEFPNDTRFTLLYTGLYCRDRTGDRLIFGPSDEPYVITVAVSVENGTNVDRSELILLATPTSTMATSMTANGAMDRSQPAGPVWPPASR